MFQQHPGALEYNPNDADLDLKLAQMANKVYKDVVVPLEQANHEESGAYERRQLNRDGTWKESRYKSIGQNGANQAS